MLNNKKCILVYNLNDEELQKLKRLPFKVIEITKEMTSMTVKNIIEGLEIETVSENSPEEKTYAKLMSEALKNNPGKLLEEY